MTPPDYDLSVFVNCPFDGAYVPLFHAILFTIIYCGLIPRSALEINSSEPNRLSRIIQIIESSRYSIHDLSRSGIDRTSGCARFNMPFELGLCVAAQRLARHRARAMDFLVLERVPFRIQKSLSDLNGIDAMIHLGRRKNAVTVVRNWLSQHANPNRVLFPGGLRIYQRLLKFERKLPTIAARLHLDADALTFLDFSTLADDWTAVTPIHRADRHVGQK